MYLTILSGEGTTGIEAVFEQIPKLFQLATQCFNYILENPILLFFFAISLVGVGLGVFRKLKRAATR